MAAHARRPARTLRTSVGGTALAVALGVLAPLALAPPAAVGEPGNASSAGLVAVEHQLPVTAYSPLFQTDIAVMRPDGSAFTPIVTGADQETDPAWSLDGSRLAYVVTQGTGSAAQSAVWTADADGSDRVQVTPPSTGAKASPTWSPGGETIAFVWNGDIWRVASDGTAAPVNGAVQSGVTGIDWSPDGTSWVASRAGQSLATLPADDSVVYGAPLNTGFAHEPAWSPDGTQVAYSVATSNVSAPLAIRRIVVAGQQSTTVSGSQYVSGEVRHPTWSPDGTRLLYARQESNGPSLVNHPYNRAVPAVASIPAAGGTATPVTGGAPRAQDPDWSPATGGGGSTDPSSGSTSTGQTFTVDVVSPADGARVAREAPLEVTGTVSLDAATARPVHAAYVIDVSGSTATSSGRNCDGVAGITAADNYNNDSRVGDILDCELWAVAKLHERVATRASATAGVVALGGTASYWDPPNASTPTTSAGADMSGATGDQPAVAAGDAAVDTVLRSMFNQTSGFGGVNRFTSKWVGTGTDYEAALRRANQQLSGFDSRDPSIVYFLSDGQPTSGRSDWTAPDHPLSLSAARGHRVHTYAVGVVSGCNVGQPLRVIAERTGGTCTQVANPELLPDLLATDATITSVTVRLPDGTQLPATVDAAAGTWTVEVPAGSLGAGEHQLVATGTASDGTTVTDTVSVTVVATPQVEAGGPYAVDEGSSVALAGSVVDADTDPADLAVAWTPSGRLDDGGRLDPTYTGVDDATQELTLTVTDPDGLEGSDTAQVTVNNVAPSLGTPTWVAGRDPVTGQEATLRVDVSDPGAADTHTYSVDWGDGSAPSTGEVTGGVVEASHTYAAGDVTAEVTVTDDDGGTATTQVGPFRVNTPPTADAGGPYTVDEGTPLSLAGSAGDADGDPLTATWSPAGRLLSGADTLTPAYDTVDEVEQDLTLLVSDGDLESSSSTHVTVRNVAPTITGFALPADVVAPAESVNVDVTIDDPGTADVISWELDWGDGTVVTGTGRSVNRSHTYGEGGRFDVVLTVSDGDGGEDSRSGTVVTNRAPTVDAGADLAVVEGSSDRPGLSSDDADGDALSHTWTPGPACAGVVALSATDVAIPEVHGIDDGACTLEVAVSDGWSVATDTVRVSVTNAAPTLGLLTATPVVVRVGTPVEVSGAVADPGVSDTHTATVDWGAGNPPEQVTLSGDLSVAHTYATPGVFTVRASVTDDDGATSVNREVEVVVYDPASANAFGAGYIDSPAGAMPAQPTAVGKANTHFSLDHDPRTQEPRGSLRFHFPAAKVELRSSAVAWVTSSDGRSTSAGTGTWGDVPARWRLTLVDGAGNDDQMRLQVWTGPALDVVAYDTGALLPLTGVGKVKD